MNNITQYGELIPAPLWLPANLPKFYRAGNGDIILRPSAPVPKYTENDVLDLLLYYQMIVGYNRIDYSNAVTAAWKSTSDNNSGYNWVVNVLKSGGSAGNFANVSKTNYTIDGALYSRLQARYVFNESATQPWLAGMQALGGPSGGINLMTIPMPTDIMITRTSFYLNYLPSLFQSAGLTDQYKRGHLTTKPLIRGNYQPSAKDIAALMMYAQPVIALGPTPYPVNWYINDFVNGAMATWYKLTLSFAPNHTNAQEQLYGITGDMMIAPVLDANPFATGFSQALENIIKYVISFFAGKIPGGSTLMSASGKLAAAGGQGITGGTTSPDGTFSNQVFMEADLLSKQIAQTSLTNNIILLALAAGGMYWAWDEGYF